MTQSYAHNLHRYSDPGIVYNVSIWFYANSLQHSYTIADLLVDSRPAIYDPRTAGVDRRGSFTFGAGIRPA